LIAPARPTPAIPADAFAMKRFVLPLFLGCCSFVGGLAAVQFGRFVPTAWAQPAAARGEPDRLEERFERVVGKVSPCVVAVEAVKLAHKEGKTKTVEESGSGVLFRPSGQTGALVLTNNHVIADAEPRQITVSLADNRIFTVARVWADPESDVAVLLLQGADNLPVAVLGDSDGVRVGQWVLAIGSPFGLNQTVTHGIISARERGQISLGAAIRIKDFLQTDAAINPGSSGGPLLNLEGEVIGVNTAIASNTGGNSGVAFSIPINMAKRVVRQLLEKGTVSRGYLGVQTASSFEAADAAKLGLDRAQGAWVETVYPNTPAAAAGLRSNDVILALDGAVVRTDNSLINVVSGLPAGQRIRLRVWRERKTLTLDAVVGDWAQGQARLRPKP
jgi:serine protease Do